jgi:hypothetical protein
VRIQRQQVVEELDLLAAEVNAMLEDEMVIRSSMTASCT